MIKILVAPNAFKESLTALEAARSIRKGLRQVLPRARIVEIPIADGGDGTLETVVAGTQGKTIRIKATGPLGNQIPTEFGISGDGTTAVIEMSRVSGLALVPVNQRNPMVTTSFGTGELIVAALKRGVCRVILGIGGSATVDGGIGALQALGVVLLDRRGKAVERGGDGLLAVRSIDLDRLDPLVKRAKIEVACDVDNPLIGPTGAAAVFGPQKGASPSMVKRLDQGLANFARLIEDVTRVRVAHIPGSGAAGGIAGALLGLLGAKLQPGSDLVFDLLRIREIIPKMDWVVTGEGRIDFQTPYGKGPGVLAKIASRHGIPVIGIAGAIADDASDLYKKGFTALFSITSGPMDLSTAMHHAPKLMERTASQIGRLIAAASKGRRRA